MSNHNANHGFRFTACSHIFVGMLVMLAGANLESPTIRCSWAVKYNFDTGNHIFPVNLSKPLTSRLRTDTLILSGGYGVGVKSPADLLGYGVGSVNKQSWQGAIDQWQKNHTAKLRSNFTTAIPKNFTNGYISHDYEAWEPSWIYTNMTNPPATANWKLAVRNLTAPVFDTVFLSTIGFVPPQHATGFDSLSETQQFELLGVSYRYVAQMFWNTTMDVSRSVCPKCQWGSWNIPAKWGPSSADAGWPTQQWQDAMAELGGWLLPQFDVFYLDLYPEIYVGSLAHRPSDLSDACGVHNHTENELYFASNIKYAQTLSHRYGGAKVVGFLWWHYMCDSHFNGTHVNTSKFVDSDNIQTPFQVGSELGIDGVILYGSISTTLTNHDQPATVQEFVNSEYVDVVSQYCDPI